MTDEDQLIEDMGRFYGDPLGFVMYAYDWGSDPALQTVKLLPPWNLCYASDYGPDAWACELLDRVGRQVRANAFDGQQAVGAIREAVASGHGIGKSALVAWLVDWIMSTRPHSRGTVTANTGVQLETRTWAQVAEWTKRCITGHWFDVSTGRGSMRMTHKLHPESWFCSAQTCREENSESFAGQHAANATSFYIFDEASAVPDAIKQVAEGGLTDGEPMMFAFGNPTRNTGWFKECFGAQRHRWDTVQVDSRSVQITNKSFLNDLIADYGEDSDLVKVRVRGMFPAMSVRQFISVADVDAAYDRHLRPEQYEGAPKILTVDPAWEGDDEFVIGLRQGLKFSILRTFAKNDNDMQMANIVAQLEDEHKADAVFIDGGFGTGVVSGGRTMGRNWVIVWFGEASSDPGCLNKRAEMWKAGRDWLKAGGAIPKDPVLHDELIGPEVCARADGKLQLEAKKDMKRRGLASPGRADALMLAFAHPVRPKSARPFTPNNDTPQKEHDPYSGALT